MTETQQSNVNHSRNHRHKAKHIDRAGITVTARITDRAKHCETQPESQTHSNTKTGITDAPH